MRNLFFVFCILLNLYGGEVFNPSYTRRIFCCSTVFDNSVECHVTEKEGVFQDSLHVAYPKSPFYLYFYETAKGQAQISFYLLKHLLQSGKLRLPADYFTKHEVSVKFRLARSGGIFEGLHIFMAMLCEMTQVTIKEEKIAWIGQIGLDGKIFAYEPDFLEKVQAAKSYNKIVIPKSAMSYLPNDLSDDLRNKLKTVEDLKDLVQYLSDNPFSDDDLSLNVGVSIGVSTRGFSCDENLPGLVHTIQVILLKDTEDLCINHVTNGAGAGYDLIPDLRKGLRDIYQNYYGVEKLKEYGLIVCWDRPIFGPSWGFACFIASKMCLDEVKNPKLIAATGGVPYLIQLPFAHLQVMQNMAVSHLPDKANGILKYGLRHFIFPEEDCFGFCRDEVDTVRATKVSRIVVPTRLHHKHCQSIYIGRKQEELRNMLCYLPDNVIPSYMADYIIYLISWISRGPEENYGDTEKAYKAAHASSLTHFMDSIMNTLIIRIIYGLYLVFWYPIIFVLDYTIGWFVKNLENRLWICGLKIFNCILYGFNWLISWIPCLPKMRIFELVSDGISFAINILERD